jgi:hypothetical protein
MPAVALAQSERPIPAAIASSRAIWAGRALSALALLFLTVDTAMKLFVMPVAVDATRQLGFAESAVFAIGAIEAACLVLYLLPRTSVLGAVLWTGYLGGAIATHLRLDSPLFSHILFPVYVAAFLWSGLWLRDGRLRQIVRTAFDLAA